MFVANESHALAQHQIEILNFSKCREIAPQHLVHYSSHIFPERLDEIADTERACLFHETAQTLHIVSKLGMTRASKNIHTLVYFLTFLKIRDMMQKLASMTQRTTASCEMEAEMRMIERVAYCVARVQVRIATSWRSTAVFGIGISHELVIPDIVFLVAFFVGTVVSQTAFKLFTGRTAKVRIIGFLYKLMCFDFFQ